MSVWDILTSLVGHSSEADKLKNIRNEMFVKVGDIIKVFTRGGYHQFEAEVLGDKIKVTLLAQTFVTIEIIHDEQRFLVIVEDKRGRPVFQYQTESLAPSEDEKRAIYVGIYDAIEGLRRKLPRNIREINAHK